MKTEEIIEKAHELKKGNNYVKATICGNRFGEINGSIEEIKEVGGEHFLTIKSEPEFFREFTLNENFNSLRKNRFHISCDNIVSVERVV